MPVDIGWNFTMRSISQLMDGFSLLDKLGDSDSMHEDMAQEDEDALVDRQLQDLKIAGLTSGIPYNITEGRK